MGRTMTTYFLISLLTAVVGAGKIRLFLFLGKGFYYACCSDLETVYTLISSTGVHSGGFLTCVMWWDPRFDPGKRLMH